jgi:hypothetical protein
MAKAPSLWKDRNKGTQRTRKLYTENKLRWMLTKWEGTLLARRGERPQVLSRVR